MVGDTATIANYMLMSYGASYSEVFDDGSRFLVCDIGGKNIASVNRGLWLF